MLRTPQPCPCWSSPTLCAGITTYSPLHRWGIGKYHKLAVVGLGGLGHVAVKISKALGTEVTVLSTSERKRKDAERLGAFDFALTSRPTRPARTRPVTGRRRVSFGAGVQVQGMSDVHVKLAKCCTPVPGDPDPRLRHPDRTACRCTAPTASNAGRPAPRRRNAWSTCPGHRRPPARSWWRSRWRRWTATGCSPTSPGHCRTSTSTSFSGRAHHVPRSDLQGPVRPETADPTHLDHVLRARSGRCPASTTRIASAPESPAEWMLVSPGTPRQQTRSFRVTRTSRVDEASLRKLDDRSGPGSATSR